MNKNTTYIIVAAIVIIIVVAGVAAYVFLYGGGGGETTETVYNFGNATSIEFTVNFTSGGVTTVEKFVGKNLNSTDLKLRVDVDMGGTSLSYLMFGNQTAWNTETGTWAVANFAIDWANWNTNQFSIYRIHNAAWMTGDGDINYTDGGNTIFIYNIALNPTIDDSAFNPM
jgi:hypothetical protein